ncbi:MAG: hypothetical protein DRO11_03860 [Methanobacteriota archaeon]|nr:MAG: hypothetical protein DRO11_03860 [Euryarchaeota archaeon]
MAKFEGTQNIPSEWLDLYRATLNPHPTGNIVKKRYPYRLPKMQKGGKGVSEAQKKQRERFIAIKNKFKTLSREERRRWYENEPPWSSFLWYYNYFIMSGLTGNAVVGDKGGGVIKSIKHYTFTMPAGDPVNITVNIDTIDPNKAVVFFYGAGVWEFAEGVGINVYPYLVSLNSSQAIVRASMHNDQAAGCSFSVIEYI